MAGGFLSNIDELHEESSSFSREFRLLLLLPILLLLVLAFWWPRTSAEQDKR